MKRIALGLLLCGSALTAVGSDKPILNADRLRNACVNAQNAPHTPDAGVCLGYISAVMDTMEHNAPKGVLIPDTFPPPTKERGEVDTSDPTVDQMSRMVIKFVADHPEREQESGSSVVLYLITTAGQQSKR
jgi:hypothetical protein